MTDFDADEKVPPIRAKAPATSYVADNILGVVGVALALGAALFPWYILVHQDRFGQPTTGNGVAVRDLGNLPRNGGWATTPRAVADIDNTTGKPASVDSLTTATVPNASTKGNPSDTDEQNQPFPSGKAFKLLHVANGMAMIEDRTGIYIVKVGAVLPDNSTLSTIDERNGKPVLITSYGDVVAAE